jgi:phospho-N-acetylmuramoyl-pentapeptide-transferase
MLYQFLVPLAKDHIVFNVFRYVTFRSFMALISGLVISLVIGPWLIRRLRVMRTVRRRSARTRRAPSRQAGTPPWAAW